MRIVILFDVHCKVVFFFSESWCTETTARESGAKEERALSLALSFLPSPRHPFVVEQTPHAPTSTSFDLALLSPYTTTMVTQTVVDSLIDAIRSDDLKTVIAAVKHLDPLEIDTTGRFIHVSLAPHPS